MRIGIVGNYGNDNQGDEAILEGIIVQLEEVYGISRQDILVFSNNPEKTHQKYRVQTVNLFQRRKTDPMKFIATIKHNKPIIHDLDLLLIGGGGILMDLYRNNPFVYGMYGWLVKRTKTPAAIFGVGVGPIRTKIGKVIIKFIVNAASVVTVRDEKSKQTLQSIGVEKPISVIADPAFFVPEATTNPKNDNRFRIGVTAVPYFNPSYWPQDDRQKYENYITGMANNLDRLLESIPSADVHFFSTKHPYDTNVTKDIQKLMIHENRSFVCDKGMNHREILDFISEQDLVIGTRLHSLILSLVAGKPIIGVSYHHKVNDFMESVICSDYVTPIETIHQNHDIFLNMYNNLNKDWETSIQRFQAITQTLKNKQPVPMELIRPIIEGKVQEPV